jgi:hypothetical protein
MGIINDSGGYTETHLIHVVAFDAAGNETESNPVRVYVAHKKTEPKKESMVPHGALVWPVRVQCTEQAWAENKRNDMRRIRR